MRFRDDKDNPNHVSVFKRIMDSIRDNVDKETLLSHAPIIRTFWKTREETVIKEAKEQEPIKRKSGNDEEFKNKK